MWIYNHLHARRTHRQYHPLQCTVQRFGTDAGGKIGKIKDLGASAAFSPPCMHQIFCWDVTGHMGEGSLFIGGSQSSYPPV